MQATMLEVSESLGYKWSIEITHIERVKQYSPRVDHLVYDLHITSNDK